MTVTIRHGDCREVLKTLPDQSVHCCVTSPPYFGLRDYGHTGQIGLEATPDAFVAEMVAVFQEVKRVLRDDGTLWLNLGDSYSGSTQTGGNNGFNSSGGVEGFKQARQFKAPRQSTGLKQKDLIGIPWRVAFALQADGWYLRQDIIWSKPNPMPESVTDRCTKAHEYIFLLSKSARYHYDAGAIAEAGLYQGPPKPGKQAQTAYTGLPVHSGSLGEAVQTRNKRSVWDIATQPFSEAHFATFPPDLIEPCIKAGCPKECCSKCGAPVVREIETGETTGKRTNPGKASHLTPQGYLREGKSRCGDAASLTVGWKSTCDCAAGFNGWRDRAAIVGGTVLDPFGGAGTTGLVADRLGRDAILIELNPDYAAMAQRRIEGDAGMFAMVSAG